MMNRIPELLDVACTIGLVPSQLDYLANEVDYKRMKILEKGYLDYGCSEANEGLFISLLYSKEGGDQFAKDFHDQRAVVESTIWARYLMCGDTVYADSKKYTVIDRVDQGLKASFLIQNESGIKRIGSDEVVLWKLPNEPYSNEMLNRWFSPYEHELQLSKEMKELGIKRDSGMSM